MNHKHKQVTRKMLVKLCDTLFSLYIRTRDKKQYGGCPFCGKPIDCAFHFFSRVNYATRWDEDNAVGSCVGCNMRMEYAPFPYYQWFKDNRGEAALEALNRKHNQIGKFSNSDLQEIAAKYRKLLESK